MLNQEQLNAIKDEYSNMDWEDFRENAGDLITREIDIYNTVVIEGVPSLVAEVERLQKRLEQTEKCYEIMEKATFKASDKLKSFREALEFYANKNSHFRADMYAESTVMQDAGKIARQALGGEVNE